MPRMALSWDDEDRMRWTRETAVAGVGIGVLLAVFGLPPVDLHGPWHYVSIMDPLCGGTRALAATFRGNLGLACRYNPLSPLLVLGALVASVRTAGGLLTGRWLNARVRIGWIGVVALGALLVLVEINQQGHAALLMAR